MSGAVSGTLTAPLRRYRARRFSTAQLRALMAEGVTQAEAARRLGVAAESVRLRLRTDGLVWPSRRGGYDRGLFARLWNCHRIATREIMTHYGISRQAVGERARRMGLPGRNTLRRKLVRDDELRELWLAGVSSGDIARLFGLASHNCVGAAVKRLGLPRRQRKGGGMSGWTGTIPISVWREMRIADRMRAEMAARKPIAAGVAGGVRSVAGGQDCEVGHGR